MYVPAFVIQNVLKQYKKSIKPTQRNEKNVEGNTKATTTKKSSNEPALYVTEKQGKRYLVINPENPLIQGFANIDDHYSSFSVPAFDSGSIMNVNGMPAYPSSPPYGTPYGAFPAPLNSPRVPRFGPGGMSFNGYPLLGGQASNGVFRGFVAVPIFSRVPPIEGPNHRGSYGGAFPFNFEGGWPRYDEQRSFHGGEPPYHGGDLPYPPQGKFSDGIDSDFSIDYRPRVDMSRFDNHDVITSTHPDNYYDDPGYDPYHEEKDNSFLDNRQETIRPFKPRPNPFSSMFGAPMGAEQINDERVRDFEGVPHGSDNSNNFQDAFASKRSEYPHFPHYVNGRPYVFTKEHVGFGPITVEAKTASAGAAKEEDPKDDD